MVVKYLLGIGTDYEKKNTHNQTPIDLLEEFKNQVLEYIDLLHLR